MYFTIYFVKLVSFQPRAFSILGIFAVGCNGGDYTHGSMGIYRMEHFGKVLCIVKSQILRHILNRPVDNVVAIHVALVTGLTVVVIFLAH